MNLSLIRDVNDKKVLSIFRVILWIFFLFEVFGCLMELIYLEIIGHFTLPSSDVQTQIGGGFGETEQFAEPI